jgi:hypothetical protein
MKVPFKKDIQEKNKNQGLCHSFTDKMEQVWIHKLKFQKKECMRLQPTYLELGLNQG